MKARLLLAAAALALLAGCEPVTTVPEPAPSTTVAPSATAAPAPSQGAPSSSVTPDQPLDTRQVEITWYGSYDNDPKGSLAIDHPVLHQTAGGTGTYDDPLTFASPAGQGEYAYGTRIYVPSVEKYFIREDSCAASWTAKDGCGPVSHVDLYIGNPSNTQAVLKCEEALTPDGNAPIVVNPPRGLYLDTTPLWDGKTCHVKAGAPVPTSTPAPVTTTPAPTTTPTPAPAGRTYPWHTNIVATTFWVGEIFNGSIADGSQVCSTYDSQWAYHWSGVKTGTAGKGTDCEGSPTGGCDGVPAKNRCDTEARKAPDFWPTKVVPRENPFYLDLPFDDVNDSTALKTRCQVIPWANDHGKCNTDPKVSYMKNRWVHLVGASGRDCYGQIEDAGPSSGSAYHDTAYVFGTNDARPSNRKFGAAGADVSPALNGCLGFKELDGDTDKVRWQFVDAPPPGPWTRVVTTSGVTP